MLIKKVRPSKSSTGTAVFKFWLSGGILKIPQEHHYNMLMGIGCKDKTLKRFINAHCCFDEKSVIDAIIDSNKQKKSILDKDFLVKHFCYCSKYGDMVQNEIAKIKGIEWMLQNDFEIEESILRNYLKNASDTVLKSLIPYAGCLKKAESNVFRSGYAPLVIAYLQTVKKVISYNVSELLIFDDVNVYKTFFNNHPFTATDEFIEKILINKSDEIVNELATFVRLNEKQEILLIKRGNFSLLKAQLDNFSNTLYKKSFDYLCQNADDAMFVNFIKLPKVELSEGDYYYPYSFYERLFKLNDKEILKNFIKSFYLPSTFQEMLLSYGDEELINEYFGCDRMGFEDKSAVFILKNGTKEQIDKLLDDDCSIGFYAEAWLFKSKLDDYIRRYLKNHSLSGFGEACLVKFANKDIVLNWLENDVIIGELSFVAAMERQDEDIINKLVELKTYFYEEERDLEAFMLHAPCNVIAHFFENMDENEYMSYNFEIGADMARKIFETREKEVQKLFVDYFDFSDDNDLANCLVAFADKEIVIEKLKDSDFSFDVEALFKRKDKELIIIYLKNHELANGDEEIALLLTLDEELVLKYNESVGFSCIEDNILNE